jgi:hypothetical protein
MKAKSGWTVAWWRGNEYDDPSPPPTLVLDSDLRDELWADTQKRRQIRVCLLFIGVSQKTDH